jgi:hypothetical protein
MLHACVQRFDVTRNLKILQNFLGGLDRSMSPPGAAARDPPGRGAIDAIMPKNRMIRTHACGRPCNAMQEPRR